MNNKKDRGRTSLWDRLKRVRIITRNEEKNPYKILCDIIDNLIDDVEELKREVENLKGKS